MNAKREEKKGKGKEKPAHCRGENVRPAAEYTNIPKAAKPSKATNDPQQPEFPDIPALISYGEQDEGAAQPRGKCRENCREYLINLSW
jgi:hypothetical protein